MPSLVPSFRLQLGNTVLPRLVCIGAFDGAGQPSLAAATSSDNLLLHSPHRRATGGAGEETRTINMNRTISALAAGDLEKGGAAASSSGMGRDVLLIGSSTSLQGYDVEANSDVFFKEVPDGVNALAYGSLASLQSPVAMVGGNCSLQGFNSSGGEVFWTVTGDNVSALAFRDVPGSKPSDNRQEVLVGSEDFEIRVFASEEVGLEMTESDVVTNLTPVHTTNFGYSLANGTVGVYNNATRVWHAKSKHTPVTLAQFDLNGDGVPELIAGWSSGRMEVRLDSTGFLVYKDKLASPFAKLMTADYRMDGRAQIVAVGVDGEVRGYSPPEAEQVDVQLDNSVQEAQLQALYEKKNELMTELRGLEKNAGLLAAAGGTPVKGAPAASSSSSSSSSSSGLLNAGMIPPSTKLSLVVKANKSTQSLLLTLASNNDTLVKMALVFSDVLFVDESICVHPKQPASTLSVPLRPSKNQQTEILVKAVVGHRSSTQDHVFELTHTLPRFASFVHTRPKDLAPRSSVTFHTSERVNRVVLWINQAFAIDASAPGALSATSDSLHAGFQSIADGSPLIIRMGPENGGTISIRTDSMELAGDVVQDLCRYLSLSNVESVAEFPDEFSAFAGVLQKVDDFNAARLKMSADIADSSNLVKMLVIKAEDARILGETALMERYYSQLYDLNKELMGEYNKRANNHAELMAALKDVNAMIQKAARLRLGEPKQRVIAACRVAIKANNTQSLLQIMKVGHAS